MAYTMHFFLCVGLVVFSSVHVSALLCRDEPELAPNCDMYFQLGGINIILEDLTHPGEFIGKVVDDFLNAVANVSDEYVLLTVTTKHTVITDVIATDGMVQVGFFVLNPSGSEVVPTAFRSQELFLMMKLNDARVEEIFGQSVKPIDPSPEPLAIPIWAIAILGYVGVVILCAVGLYATKNRRRKWQEQLEKSLQMSNLEKGKQDHTKIPMTYMNENKPEKVPIVTYAEVGVQTTRKKPKGQSKEQAAQMAENETAVNAGETPNGDTVQATIENGGEEVTGDKPIVEKSGVQNDNDDGAVGDIPKTREALKDDERPDEAKTHETEGALNNDDNAEKNEMQDEDNTQL